MDRWMLWGWEVGMTSEEEVQNSGNGAFCWLGSELSMTAMAFSQFRTHREKWKSKRLQTQTTHGPLWFLYKADTDVFEEDALVNYLPNVQLHAFLPAVHPAHYAFRLVDSWTVTVTPTIHQWTCWSGKPAPAQDWSTEGSDWKLENILYNSTHSHQAQSSKAL